MKHFGVLTCLLLLTITSNGKVFERYDLAKLLYDNGLTDITRWICMIGHLSGFDTNKFAKGEGNTTGYGLFTIFEPYWCGLGKKGGQCDIVCDDLRNDDVSDDVECVKLILDQQGIGAWAYTLSVCRNDTLSDIPDWVWARSQAVDAQKYCPPQRDRSRRSLRDILFNI